MTELYKAPTSGFDLAKTLGVGNDEGVQVALFPDKVEEVTLTELSYPWDPGVKAWGLIGNLGTWGNRLLDVVTEPEVNVKWWKVVGFAKEHGHNLVPIRYTGSILDIPGRYFEPGTIVGVRLYNHGPWFWPLEQPAIAEAVDPEADNLGQVVDALNAKNGYK